MSRIDRYKELQQQAEEINKEIAGHQGARKEVLRQLQELGVDEKDLDAEISRLQQEVTKLETEMDTELDKLAAAITTAKAILNE